MLENVEAEFSALAAARGKSDAEYLTALQAKNAWDAGHVIAFLKATYKNAEHIDEILERR